ncbi:MAG: hypothetical protein DMF59_18040 [Acidobacteria bacterium]|nr:MAG: hypothetical protein DMF59_18040 [Acidobacteriota bacterium]
MAKVQGKKKAARAPKRPAKKALRRPARPKAAARRPVKKTAPAPKKKAVKPPKPAARVVAKPKAPLKPPPPPAKVAPKGAAPQRPAPEKKRARRPRTRISSSGAAVATWFTQGEKPRPSSFIPAPPRAEAPSLVAAPPASSDRLVASHELTEFAVRTVPVRVDVEAGGGRIFLAANPDDAILRVGEGIEWDFRYVAGADVTVDELIIEFEKPSPFTQSTFRSRRPGTARPHRQLSGAVHKNAAGKRIPYTIRAINAFKTEMAVARPWVTVEV